ncbi:hypothetical protein L5515_015033 [Caenorhabditis briggsae]|uniref:Uncharacterized protein n=1 Tax=Caenorhabditis briggsae TaxID=6238 RepID=A0AAE9J9G9_CAEBR|nr:hypothetical protein L5515_015033 [Caenorhabditis briggsae]
MLKTLLDNNTHVPIVKNTRKKTLKRSSRTTKKSKGPAGSKRNSSRPAKQKGPRGSLTKSSSRPKTPEKEGKEVKKDRKRDDWKEPEPVAEKDGDGNRSKGSQALPSNCQQLPKPRKLEIRTREVDQVTFERVFEKFTKEKREKSQAPSTLPLDERSRILMDRVNKKPFKPEKSEMFADEPSSFYRKTSSTQKKKMEESQFLDDDSYSQVPRLINVRKMPGENVFTDKGCPFWAEHLEPTEEEMKDVEESITVGTDHIEHFHANKIRPFTIPNTKVELDELQPLVEMKKRDQVHFDPRLVFSNTLRSLIFLCASDEMKKKRKQEKTPKSAEALVKSRFDNQKSKE